MMGLKGNLLSEKAHRSNHKLLKISLFKRKIEGKNNLIKVIKRIAFGFRTFRHLRMRVLIQQNICEII